MKESADRRKEKWDTYETERNAEGEEMKTSSLAYEVLQYFCIVLLYSSRVRLQYLNFVKDQFVNIL